MMLAQKVFSVINSSDKLSPSVSVWGDQQLRSLPTPMLKMARATRGVTRIGPSPGPSAPVPPGLQLRGTSLGPSTRTAHFLFVCSVQNETKSDALSTVFSIHYIYTLYNSENANYLWVLFYLCNLMIGWRGLECSTTDVIQQCWESLDEEMQLLFPCMYV